MTSINSGIEPQNGDATEHSCGGLLKLTGRVALPTPTMVRWPSTRATCAAMASVALTATRSSTSSAPWPLVMSLMRLTASSPEIRASSAPNVLAIFELVRPTYPRRQRSSRRLSALSTWIAIWPRPPAPITTAVEPGPSRCSERFTAW